MAISNKIHSDLVALLSAGAGLELNGSSKIKSDLVALASAAKRGGGQLTLSGMGSKIQSDLVAIASAGNGHVTFRD
jgi:hypothetical protein